MTRPAPGGEGQEVKTHLKIFQARPPGGQHGRGPVQAQALIGTDRVQGIVQIKPRLYLYNGQDLAASGQEVNLALRRLEAKPQNAIALKN
jgi:hypothetical protein